MIHACRQGGVVKGSTTPFRGVVASFVWIYIDFCRFEWISSECEWIGSDCEGVGPDGEGVGPDCERIGANCERNIPDYDWIGPDVQIGATPPATPFCEVVDHFAA
jgi:hypothetical protein